MTNVVQRAIHVQIFAICPRILEQNLLPSTWTLTIYFLSLVFNTILSKQFLRVIF